MEREELSSFKDKELIHAGEGSRIYRLPDKRLLKVASPIVFKTCWMLGVSYEDKILATNARNINEILNPLTAVYDRNQCCAYTMEEVVGQDLTTYDNNLTIEQRSDLRHYYELYKKIVEVVIKGNKEGIVFPDLCTSGNIIVLPDGNIKFIDYDGMQLGLKDRGIGLSTSLGNVMKYLMSSKFNDGSCRFTQEVDKTSLVILMFLLVFNMDLTKIGMYNPFDKKTITLKDMFDLLGIDDPVFMNKVADTLSTDKNGVFLQDELYRLSQEYEMRTTPINIGGKEAYIKKLIHK